MSALIKCLAVQVFAHPGVIAQRLAQRVLHSPGWLGEVGIHIIAIVQKLNKFGHAPDALIFSSTFARLLRHRWQWRHVFEIGVCAAACARSFLHSGVNCFGAACWLEASIIMRAAERLRLMRAFAALSPMLM